MGAVAIARRSHRVRAPSSNLIVKAAIQAFSLWFVLAGTLYILMAYYETGSSISFKDEEYHHTIDEFYGGRSRNLRTTNNNKDGAVTAAGDYQNHSIYDILHRSSSAALLMHGGGGGLTNRELTLKQKIQKRKKKREKAELRLLKEGMDMTHNSTLFDFNPNQNFSNYPFLPSDNRILPDMTTDKGGVIFFLHIPKTGGQTIRHNFGFKWLTKQKLSTFLQQQQGGSNSTSETTKLQQQYGYQSQLNMDALVSPNLMYMNKITFVMANRLDVFLTRAVPKINHFLSGGQAGSTNRGKILLVEVHGMDNFHAKELEPYLQAWRKRSKQTNVPFFSFTIIREPISEQVSFFNFYYIHPGDTRFCGDHNSKKIKTTSTRCRERTTAKNRTTTTTTHRHHHRHQDEEEGEPLPTEDELLELTIKRNEEIDLEEAMIQSIYENPQCLFLARGERTFGSGADATELRRQNLNQKECDDTYDSLRRTMDWIGRTDTLTSETLPLLTTMMFQKPSIGRELQKVNASPKQKGFVVLSDIQNKTRKILEESTRLDQKLYQRVVQDYWIDQFVNYH